MSNLKIASAERTNMDGITNFDYSVAQATAAELTEVRVDWLKWKGYYDKIPELQSVIDRKAMWVVGKGYKADERTKKILDRIRGNGKDTFDSIMFNAVRVYSIAGNFFAEIVKSKRGELRNVKPLDPSTIIIKGNSRGMIKGYEQEWKGEVVAKFDPEDILHLSWSRLADHLEGTGSIQKLEDIILKRNEALNDLKTVFHRYVKPLLITSVDSDDTSEVSAFKEKLDKSVELGENLVVPKDTVSAIERVSIPQYSTLDPLPWINLLQKQFIVAEGVPEVVLGHGADTTEASAKILYLAFQQMVEYNQLFLEQQLKAQLGIEVEFNFPVSLEPDIKSDNMKDPKINSMGVEAGKDQQ